jgi:hypothetical protein
MSLKSASRETKWFPAHHFTGVTVQTLENPGLSRTASPDVAMTAECLVIF